ncbi:NADPH-dependent F420 reductase [Phytomonospora endophytica]|uniref:Pyrroline-5-carboxylate reductase catalytic N-terminal domain-containing protein n=1 Tax=Phytomonospora endophytica TaxID=714109 RepID=A0A841FRD7_9ACTN|nr:NAD(P)-binding domain-containing protein [Phytomonospora endophytica]MBB6036112.1 hypothetical protein [Phytomonospora endophytica]GIG67015.1 NADPH-dependent F420 reductase [Phytomonospora endophytica]
MRFAVLGTGEVGRTLAAALARRGHDVHIGSRSRDNTDAAAWAETNGVAQGSFADAAAFGEIVIVAVSGMHATAVLGAAGRPRLAGKVVIDVTNPLDFSRGFPPRVVIPEEGSLGAHLQAMFPEARLVKTLNTTNNAVMADPASVPGEHCLFLSGDDPEAKAVVTEVLSVLGWRAEQLIDLGGIATARGPEQMLVLWCDLTVALPGRRFNFGVAHD